MQLDRAQSPRNRGRGVPARLPSSISRPPPGAESPPLILSRQHDSRLGTRVQVECLLNGARLVVQLGGFFLQDSDTGEEGGREGEGEKREKGEKGVVVVVGVVMGAGRGGDGGGVVVVESSSFPFLSSSSTCAATMKMVEVIAAITPSARCHKIPQIQGLNSVWRREKIYTAGERKEKEHPGLNLHVPMKNGN